ncbi:MAG: anti-sigma factor [Pseudomonadota bacterium]
MTSADTYDPDDNALAAEYALHLLSPEDRKAFEARMLDDANLRAMVRDWDKHFHALSDEFADVAPPARVKSAINHQLFEGQNQIGPLQRFGRWILGGGAIAVALAVVLIVALPQLNDPLAIDPTHRAEVSAEDQSLIITAQFSSDDGTFVVRRVAGMPADGRDHEMWLIPEGATAPISLGVIPMGAEARIDIPDDLRGQLTAALFAISDEPKGGSPTGAPTGAVLAAGPVQTL